MKNIKVKDIALKAAGTTVGAVAGAALNKVSFIGNQKPLVRAAIKMAAGAFLPQLAKAKAGSVVDSAANGLMAIAGLELANSFMPSDKKFTIAGIGDLPALGYVGSTISFDEDYHVAGSNSSYDGEIDLD